MREYLPKFDQLSAITGIGRFSVEVQKSAKAKEKPEISQLKISGFHGDPSGIRTPDTLLKRQNSVKIAYKITSHNNLKYKYALNLFDVKCNFLQIMHFSGLENGLERHPRSAKTPAIFAAVSASRPAITWA